MLKFKTTKLQETVAKAFKGVGNNKVKPITELMALKYADGNFTLISTDGDDFMYVSMDNITSPAELDGVNFYAVVQANQFSKLVARLTSEDVSLDVVNDCLEIRANGLYRIPVEIDRGTGQIVEYTDPMASLIVAYETKIGEISAQDISTILRALKPALALTVDIPQYVHYYVGETVLATDTDTANCYGKALTTTPVLVSAAVMEMLNVYTETNPLTIYKLDNKLVFRGDNFTLLGYAMPGVGEFAIDKINAYMDTAYPSKCKIPKQELIQALDRLSLFVSDFDDDTIGIDFTADGLRLSSKQSDSVETIKYISSENLQEIQCFIYLNMLMAQVKAQTGDSIDLYFGQEKSIKIVDDACNVTSVVCLVV